MAEITKVKNFKLDSSSGDVFELSKMKHKFCVLFFYPKDNTPGCTLEAQQFTKLKKNFEKLDIGIYGVSRDTLKSHANFIEKCDLGIELLSDEDEKLCDLFDVIKEKNMYGKKVLGVERSTFILDPSGKVIQSWRKVKAEGHAQEVLEFAKTL